ASGSPPRRAGCGESRAPGESPAWAVFRWTFQSDSRRMFPWASPKPALFGKPVSVERYRPEEAPLDSPQTVVKQHRHETRDEPALKDEGGVAREKPGNDDFAEPLGGDGGA